MATLDSRFICVSDLELYMVDNSSGLPLSGGIVTFYSDVNRTTLKPVYQLTGTPGNYTYAPLNNPCTLSSAGTFQDGLGNNIVPYYYPFTGTPAQNTGVQELYYIVVQNSGFVPQFTRQGWPQAAAGGNNPPFSDNEIENYIPNGQFLAHNNIVSLTEPPITQYTFGSQTVDAQAIAQGGWYFVYTDATTATFNNSFSQIPPSGGWNINSFPKYAFNFVCSAFNANALTRDLRIQWSDINKFSSGNPPGTTPYTLFFDAKSNDGNSYTFTLNIIYYFGTGGSPSSPVISPPNGTPIATFTVGPSLTFVSHNIQNIVFPADQGTIGTNGDDYIALSITGPASDWNVSFTDFALVQGNETLSVFPTSTNAQMLSQGVAGWMPTPNPSGTDLYLPLILTPQGMTFDHAQVGSIVAKQSNYGFSGSISTLANELLADGSQYLSAGYSPLGIPYSRLATYYMSSGIGNVPEYGTGLNFATTELRNGDELLLCNNSYGTGQAAADTGSTGFSFRQLLNEIGQSNVFISRYELDNVYCQSGTLTMADSMAAPTGITFTPIRNNTSSSYVVYSIVTTAVTVSAMASTYFTFTANSTSYYVWFKYNGSGTDPAPGGTGILINLYTGYGPSTVAQLLVYGMSGGPGASITTVAGSSVVANSWFSFAAANTNKYYVWYSLNGTGTDPTPAGYTLGIPVSYTTGMTAAQIATATQIAINSTYFRVPYLQGMFLRGYDPNKTWDVDATIRFGSTPDIYGDAVGTFEYDQLYYHDHTVPLSTTSPTTYAETGASDVLVKPTGSTATSYYGGNETRPVNAYVVWAVKY